MIRTSPRPRMESWKACAVPWNLVETVAGNTSVAAASICATASPSATPGARLNEMVTDGSCPVWPTLSGPALVVTLATVFSGTSLPDDDRTYSSDMAAGSCWNSGATPITTRSEEHTSELQSPCNLV